MAGRLSGVSFARTECKYKEKSESSEFFGNIFIPIFRSDGFRGRYGGLPHCGRGERGGLRVRTRPAERGWGAGGRVSCRCRAVRSPAARSGWGTAEGAGGTIWEELEGARCRVSAEETGSGRGDRSGLRLIPVQTDA